MTTVNVTFRLAKNLAQTLTTFTTKLENGEDAMVCNPTVRGEVMALIVSWSAFISNGYDHMTDASGGLEDEDDCGTENDAKNDIFIKFILKHKRTVLIELVEASFALELWPLFELCCRAMTKLIANAKTVDEAKTILGVTDDHGIKLSAPVIKGVLEYLPIEKRLELDASSQNEWRLACTSVWSEVKVLFLSSGQSTIEPEQCKHTIGRATKMNSMKCTEVELKQNIESIRNTGRRKIPERFLDIIRKCTNLKAIVWDKKFGEMADTKLARVLDRNCPHLEHIEGIIKKKFQFKLKGRYVVSPASFIDIFEPTKIITCLRVFYEKDVHQAVRPIDQDTAISLLNMRKEIKLKARLRPILDTVLHDYSETENCAAVDKPWFDKFQEYVSTDSTDKPGKRDMNKVIERKRNGENYIKRDLVHMRDYIWLPLESAIELAEAFGVIEFRG